MKALGLVLLLWAGCAEADTVTTWTVDYTTRGTISQVQSFYGPGAYLFLWTPAYDTVYLQENNNWVFKGLYGQVELPPNLPPIVFAGGVDEAVAWSTTTIPEPPTLAMTLAGIVTCVVACARMKRGRGQP